MRWCSWAVLLAACTPAAPRPPAPVCAPVARACDRAVADSDAHAIVQRRCVKCHVAPVAGQLMVDALAACEMPPVGLPLEAAERARLVAWAACGQRELNSFLYSP